MWRLHGGAPQWHCRPGASGRPFRLRHHVPCKKHMLAWFFHFGLKRFLQASQGKSCLRGKDKCGCCCDSQFTCDPSSRWAHRLAFPLVCHQNFSRDKKQAEEHKPCSNTRDYDGILKTSARVLVPLRAPALPQPPPLCRQRYSRVLGSTWKLRSPLP